MIPVITAEEANALDAAAADPLDVLIGRAGAAVATAAGAMLGGSYGRRVTVIAGKGHNGDDGRVAARILERRGVRVEVVDAAACPPVLPTCDLVVDAAFGTGFRGTWAGPSTQSPVLAVDIPSGLDARTGDAGPGVLAATVTVTFAGLKPGLLLGRGPELSGEVVVADIGLDAGAVARAWLVDADDLRTWLPHRSRDAHKWQAATWIVAGSAAMTGAAVLATRGAQRAGASYVRLSVPGVAPGSVPDAPREAVSWALPAHGWADDVADGDDRFRSLVVGPGLGRDSDDDVRRLLGRVTVPLVLDGDGLTAVAPLDGALPAGAVITPHDGELRRLLDRSPGPDRLDEARQLAARAGCTVLLKGSLTTVAGSDGTVLLANEGSARLATAGTGDVLSGIIGALLAQGLPPLEAAAGGAWLHGAAAAAGPARGLVAGDLPDFLPSVFDRLER
ncbi:MAG TPA: NAD(P)H-hydrate dehydratase [Acidimicrobiales bacterium]